MAILAPPSTLKIPVSPEASLESVVPVMSTMPVAVTVPVATAPVVVNVDEPISTLPNPEVIEPEFYAPVVTMLPPPTLCDEK